MPCPTTERPLRVFILNKRMFFFVQLHGLQQEGKYISCKVTKSVFSVARVFPGNISTSVKQEVSS